MNHEEADIAILISKYPQEQNYSVEVVNNGLTVATGEYITKLSALKFASFELLKLRDQQKEQNNA
jgi:hypothetical protein